METVPESTPEKRQILRWIGRRVLRQENDPTFLPIDGDATEDRAPAPIIWRGSTTMATIGQQALENGS